MLKLYLVNAIRIMLFKNVDDDNDNDVDIILYIVSFKMYNIYIHRYMYKYLVSL